MKRLLRTIPLLNVIFTHGNKSKFPRRKSPCIDANASRSSPIKFFAKFLFALSFSLLFSANIVRAQVVINEVGIAPTGGTDGNGGEYIELFNKSGCTQNISCFTVVFSGTSGGSPASPTGWTLKIPSGLSIPS